MATYNYQKKFIYFRGEYLPEEGSLAGYALILDYLEEKTGKQFPTPSHLSITTAKHQRYSKGRWEVFTKRHRPKDDIISHLVFALKYEGVDLYTVKCLFASIGSRPIVELIKREPTGRYARKIWFLYEWLFSTRLAVADTKAANYVDLIDPRLQYHADPVNSPRHKVRNNLPGTVEFCPTIRKTQTIETFIAKDLSGKVERGLSAHDKNFIRRTAAYLLLKDSKASFDIEGESPKDARAKNWGRIIGEAGAIPLSVKEIERLQDIVIGTKKLRQMGIRTGEGFIGDHDNTTFEPVPEHISAKAVDLPSLMSGLIETNQLLQKSGYDAVLTAATISFGFVFIHPLLDGNGRIHRYIIHHILSSYHYTQKGIIFPVSASMLDNIAAYEKILQAYSQPRLDLVEWETTSDNNISITNETADHYRYFDLTLQAEFLYSAIEDTIDRIIPAEFEYLRKYDQMKDCIDQQVSLPDNKVDLMIKFMEQNNGVLSKAKRKKYFEGIEENDFQKIEDMYTDIYL